MNGGLKRLWRICTGTLTTLFFTVNMLTAQEGTYKIQWLPNGINTTVKGEKIIKEEFFQFKGAQFDRELVPGYATSFKLPHPGDNFQLDNLKYEPIPDSILAKVKLPAVLPVSEPTIIKYFSGRNEAYVDISIDALRRNSISGKIEKLIEFDVKSLPGTDYTSYSKPFAWEKLQTNSLLSSGYWYKIKVSKTGIYKLTFEDLKGIGFSNPSNIRVYGNGGRQLGYWNDDPRPVDLNEIPIYISKGSDAIFNEGDYILFYAEGTISWKLDTVTNRFNQSIHGYSDAVYYFLTTSQGPATTIPTIDNRSLTSTINVNSYDNYICYEKELYNLISSGRTWYSSRIDGVPFDSVFTIPAHIPDDSVNVVVTVAGRSGGNRYASLKIDGQLKDTYTFPTVTFAYSWERFAWDGTLYADFKLADESFDLGVSYSKIDLSDECYLNSITINSRSYLDISNHPFIFRDRKSVGEGSIANYTITNISDNFQVWDITNINNVSAILGEQSGTTYSFKARAEELHEYAGVNLDYNYPTPVINDDERGVGEVLNQNIRGLPVYNYIIVAPDVFLEQAERLANHHRGKGELSVLVITPEIIYNEFSSGTPDAVALRDFFRHQYLNSTSNDSLRYVLLFGDGSFNNHMYVEGNTNYIPTYETINSLEPAYSYVSDDFFGLLNEGRGSYDLAGKLEIGVGRLTVKLVDGSDYEAVNVVDKIISYDTCEYSDSRRSLCFVGDDGFDAPGTPNYHQFMDPIEDLVDSIELKYPGFESRKLYLDAYPQVNTAIGAVYPDVNRELISAFNKGMLVMTYFGHGSENQIAGESILTKQDMMSIKNKKIQPLIMTGSCSVSKYDQVETEDNNPYDLIAKTSMGEEALLNPEGGAIALLSTTRVVYNAQNVGLITAVFSYLFEKDQSGNQLRLGDIVRNAKNCETHWNKHNFSLLGDPALRLAIPRYRVITDSINHKAVTEMLDTLKAFSTISISGHVAFDDSTIIEDFNGLVYPSVYDKRITITTFGNDNVEPFVYKDQQNLLYKGKATVTNGRFSFDFIVPKDITYNVDTGKISYYAENGIIDAKGDFRGVNVGGTDVNAEDDIDGPEITLYLNDERFEDGGITNPEPYIHALLYDIHGINTSGVGIGHDIVGVLDDDDVNPYILNDYYIADIDNFRSGKVRYKMSGLEEGEHELYLKAWDIYNNSSIAYISFIVEISDGLIIKELINYPNPAQEFTQFQYTHNCPDEIHDVVLDVFDIMGNRVATIKQSQYESGFVSAPLYWDLKGPGGALLAPGLYPYRLKVSTSTGTTIINQKLIILR